MDNGLNGLLSGDVGQGGKWNVDYVIFLSMVNYTEIDWVDEKVINMSTLNKIILAWEIEKL